MTEEEEKVAALKKDFHEKRQAAEKAAYAWFCECEVGPERERAHEIYTNILYATRTA